MPDGITTGSQGTHRTGQRENAFWQISGQIPFRPAGILSGMVSAEGVSQRKTGKADGAGFRNAAQRDGNHPEEHQDEISGVEEVLERG